MSEVRSNQFWTQRISSNDKYWNRSMETLSKDELYDLRMTKLKKQLAYCYERSEFWRKRFKDVGFEPGDIKEWDDFRKIPPLMNKEIERESRDESLKRYGHPLGMHLCVPLEKIIGSYHTSGTTGMPTYTYTFTQHDFDVWTEGFNRMWWRIGLRPGQRLLFALGMGTYVTQAVLMACQRFGLFVLPVGAEGGSKRLVEYTRLFHPQILMLTPSYAEFLIERVPELTGKSVSELGYQKVIVCGEPGFGIPSVRRKLLDAFGCEMYEYWAPEAEAYAISCNASAYAENEYTGMHEVAPDVTIYSDDLVDPETRKPLEIKDGVIGEGLITSLDREGVPLIKYSLGDIVQVFTSPCECGYSGNRVKVVGRSDDMLIVKGVNIYPAAIRHVVNSLVPKVTGALRIVLTSKPPRVEPPLRIKVEYGPDVTEDELPELAARIKSELHTRNRVTPEIEWVPPGTLGRTEKKTQIFEKRYEE